MWPYMPYFEDCQHSIAKFPLYFLRDNVLFIFKLIDMSTTAAIQNLEKKILHQNQEFSTWASAGGGLGGLDTPFITPIVMSISIITKIINFIHSCFSVPAAQTPPPPCQKFWIPH